MRKILTFTVIITTVLFNDSCMSSSSINSLRDEELQSRVTKSFYKDKNFKIEESSNLKNTVSKISKMVEKRMRDGGSYRDNCPVPLKDLRYLRLKYFGFDEKTHIGEMIVHKDVADEVLTIFSKLYTLRYPIRKMNLISNYKANDDKSMEADNTSAFNCRRVTGGKKWSKHSFGKAIDINPRENPYVKKGKILPVNGRKFAKNRKTLNKKYKYVIIENSQIVDIFAQNNWKWGGEWKTLKDYQHFEKRY